MSINYYVVLGKKEGISYDVMWQGKHLGITFKGGKLVECFLIDEHGDNKETDIGTKADFCNYLFSTKVSSLKN